MQYELIRISGWLAELKVELQSLVGNYCCVGKLTGLEITNYGH